MSYLLIDKNKNQLRQNNKRKKSKIIKIKINLIMFILKLQKRNNNKNLKNLSCFHQKNKLLKRNIMKKYNQLKSNIKIKQIQQENINLKLLTIQV